MNLEYAKILWKHTVQNQGLSEEQLLTIGFEDGLTAVTHHASLIILAAKDLLRELEIGFKSVDEMYSAPVFGVLYKTLDDRIKDYEKTHTSTNR